MTRFDDLFGSLTPRGRNKTLTALAGAEPTLGAQHPAVQRLQFFLSESRWDPDRVNARRLELLLADPATAPHGGGVLVISEILTLKPQVKAHPARLQGRKFGLKDMDIPLIRHETALPRSKQACTSQN